MILRKVEGGAVHNGTYLGSVIRWYYSTENNGCIVYADCGDKVPSSESANPAMILPQGIPSDIDYERYIRETESIIFNLGIDTLI